MLFFSLFLRDSFFDITQVLVVTHWVLWIANSINSIKLIIRLTVSLQIITITLPSSTTKCIYFQYVFERVQYIDLVLNAGMENNHLQTPEYKISVILLQVLEKLKEEPVAGKLKSARQMAGNDTMKTMQYVLPIVMQVEMEVLKFHGYDDSREGLIKFTQLVKELEELDSAIRNLHDVLKSQYLPPVSVYHDKDSSSVSLFE